MVNAYGGVEMANEDLIRRIVKGIEDCDSMNGTHIFLARSDAVQLIKVLSGGSIDYSQKRSKQGKVLFYCSNCGRSFRADPREDQECLKKWNYHTWYADCPLCKKEVRQTDMYWR